MKTIEEMQAEVYENNVAHGWFEEERSVGDDVAHLHAEVSEMWEAYRVSGLLPVTDFDTGKPDDFASEVADVFIRLLDTCKRRGIDLRAEYERKMAYNLTRPYKHGKNL